MKISKLIKELEYVKETHGDIETRLQDAPKDPEVLITGYETFFIVPEEYREVKGEKGTVVCNIRWWPY